MRVEPANLYNPIKQKLSIQSNRKNGRRFGLSAEHNHKNLFSTKNKNLERRQIILLSTTQKSAHPQNRKKRIARLKQVLRHHPAS